MQTTHDVLDEVYQERLAQERLWGEQNHPDGTGGLCPLRNDGTRRSDVALWAKRRTDDMGNQGRLTFEAILTEEWAEALVETDPVKLRAELLQVAGVAVQWVEAIDRRTRKVETEADETVGARETP